MDPQGTSVTPIQSPMDDRSMGSLGTMESSTNNAPAAAPAPSRPEKYNKLFTFDCSDLEIFATYKGKMVIGKVASQFMRIASHVWKSVLDPRCLPRQIDCSADNVEALLILLHIAHLRFNDIPKVLGLMELTNLAVLCEKYECRDPVRHWSGDWIKYLKSKADAPTHFADDQWLYIACVFREKSIFDATPCLSSRTSSCQPAEDLSLSNIHFHYRSLAD